MKIRIIAAVFGLLVAASLLTGCTSDADMASENISRAAEQFEVQRTLTGINGITGATIFYAEGRCSFEESGNRVDATCKYGPNDIRRHTFLYGDQDSVVISQEGPLDVSVYHTRIIIKPENLLPEFDLEVGEQ